MLFSNALSAATFLYRLGPGLALFGLSIIFGKRALSYSSTPIMDDDLMSYMLALKMQEEDAQVHAVDEEKTIQFLREERLGRERCLENKRYFCGICLSRDVSLNDMVTLSCQPVGHRFCSECFEGYCSSKVNDGQVDSSSLVCPSVGCNTCITPHELKANVSPETYAKYEKFTLHAVCKDNDWKCCPHCNDWFADIPVGLHSAGVWARVQCQNRRCLKAFCGRCGQNPHATIKMGRLEMTCEEYAELKSNDPQNAMLRVVAKAAGWQQCPRCKHMTERSAGCKFMVCRCRASFCYLCGVELTAAQHCSHYRGPGCTGPFGERCVGMTNR